MTPFLMLISLIPTSLTSGITVCAANVVCGKVKAFVPVEITEVEKHVSGILAKGFGVELEALANGTEITVIGLDAHGSMPELGKNAMQATPAHGRGQTRYRHSSQQVRI